MGADDFDQIEETPIDVHVKQVSISLKDIVRKRDLDHVIFEPVPKSSHLYIKSNVPDPKRGNKLTYFKHLL